MDVKEDMQCLPKVYGESAVAVGVKTPKEDMINVVFTGEHQGLAMPHHLPVAGYLNM